MEFYVIALCGVASAIGYATRMLKTEKRAQQLNDHIDTQTIKFENRQ